MTDDPHHPRRPLGERDPSERLPFGERPPAQRPQPGAEPPDDSHLRSWTMPPLWDETEEEGPEGEHPSDEPAITDEPGDAPGSVAVRKQRDGSLPEASILKQPLEPPALELDAISYPAADAEAAATQRPGAAIQFGVLWRSMGAIFLSAIVFASLLTWWTPTSFLPADSVDQLSVALATRSGQVLFVPTLTPIVSPTPAPLTNVGIVSGHRGLHPTTGLPDPGAVCEDGLTEQEVVEKVALNVADLLSGHGYQVEVFDEFDPRLQGYRALAMISIHADSCEFINDLATGFKVASFSASSSPEQDARLVSCLIARYRETTGMAFHPSVTFDMTEYHNFSEIAPGTPGAIIEVGFLYLDRVMLTDHADVIALGVARGLLCYLRDEPTGLEGTATSVEIPTPGPTSTRVP